MSSSEFTILQSVELSQVNRFLDAPLILAVQRAPLLNSAVLLSFDKLSQQPSPPSFSWHQLKYLDISTSDGYSFPERQTLSALAPVSCDPSGEADTERASNRVLVRSIAGDSGLLPQLEELYVSMAFGDRQGVVLSPPIRDILSIGRWSQTRGWSKTRAMKIVDLEFYWDNYEMESVRRLREFDNFRIRRLEHDSAILENPDLRDEILAIRQLGGILKESLVLSHRGTFVENKLFENLPSINSLFNELESLLQHVNLMDAEFKWVGETHYVLLTVVF
ncbi:hypothetical protein L218DRAFT_1008612 [Marasmius fiardii PR-910]|nr:hypothetical protein L218DRAFT_1008612 [Marasmius fiardii PR-910]